MRACQAIAGWVVLQRGVGRVGGDGGALAIRAEWVGEYFTGYEYTKTEEGMTEPYTLTGASDWKMLAILVGGGFAFFNIVVVGVIWRWVDRVMDSISEVTAGIAQLTRAVAEREISEQRLKNEVLMQMNSIGMSFTLAIDTAFDKMEARAHSALEDHVRQQDKDINSLANEIRSHKSWTTEAIKDCHEKRESQWEKIQKIIDDCQGDCCPRSKA
jgi:hypothetical protein